MTKKAHTPEQIINKLREAEVLLCQGDSIGEASRKIGVTEQTYYRWRKEYGGMRVEQAIITRYYGLLSLLHNIANCDSKFQYNVNLRNKKGKKYNILKY